MRCGGRQRYEAALASSGTRVPATICKRAIKNRSPWISHYQPKFDRRTTVTSTTTPPDFGSCMGTRSVLRARAIWRARQGGALAATRVEPYASEATSLPRLGACGQNSNVYLCSSAFLRRAASTRNPCGLSRKVMPRVARRHRNEWVTSATCYFRAATPSVTTATLSICTIGRHTRALRSQAEAFASFVHCSE